MMSTKSCKSSVFVAFRTNSDLWNYYGFNDKSTDSYLHSNFGTIISILESPVCSTVAELKCHRSYCPHPHHFPGISINNSNHNLSIRSDDVSSFYLPHRFFVPVILHPQSTSIYEVFSESQVICQSTQRSSFHESLSSTSESSSKRSSFCIVTPRKRCVIIVDAHVASCLKFNLLRSVIFQRRFFSNLKNLGAFNSSVSVNLPSKSHDASSLEKFPRYDYLVEIFTVWPWQIVDHAW